MKKLYNRTALFHARAIVGLFALCLLALPSPALAQAIDLKLTNVTVKEAIEALNQREYAVKTLKDGWTVKTCDGGLAAHFEHTMAITTAGAEVLTHGWEEPGWTL